MIYTPRHSRPAPRAVRVLAVLGVFAVVVSTPTAASAASNGNSNDKQTICHATDSDSNPYRVETPDKNGDVSGHADHDGPVWNATLKDDHIKWGDIIPPFTYNDHGTTATFPGQNWDYAGQAIFRNGCVVPPLSLSVVKTNNADGNSTFTDDETAATAAQAVPFKVTVTNTSAVPVVVDSITDVDTATGNAIAFTCAPPLVGTILAPGASATCSFTAAAYSPVGGKKRTNLATVTVHEQGGTATKSADDTSVVRTPPPAVPVLGITVTKTNDANANGTFTDDETAPTAGQAVPFQVTVSNTSDVAVVIDSITDVDTNGNVAIPFSCAEAFVGTTISAGSTKTCAFTVTGYSPPANGKRTNRATVVVHQANNSDATTSDQDTSVVRTGPAPVKPVLTLTVDKTNNANGTAPYSDDETSATAGQAVPFAVTVTNDSAVSVIVDSVTDVVEGTPVTVTCDPNIVGTTLAPKASATCFFTLTGYSPAAGSSKENIATVTVHQVDDRSNTKSDSDDSTVRTATDPPPPPAKPTLTLTVDKTDNANGDTTFSDDETSASAGQAVAFQVTVTNGSDVAVVIDSIADSVGGTPIPVTCDAAFVGTTLAAKASRTCAFTLTGYSPAAGTSKTNLATVVVHQVGDTTNTKTGSDTAVVRTASPTPPPPVPPTNPGKADLAVVKTGPATASPGDTLTWTITVTNNGTAAAPSVQLSDVVPTGVTLTLAPTSAGWTCTGTVSVVCDLNAALPPTQSVVLTLVGVLDPGYTDDAIVNTAVVGPTDDTPGDNTSTATTTVVLPLVPNEGGGEITGGGGGITPDLPVTGGGGGVTLPRTGAPIGMIGLVAQVLFAVGGLLVLMGRRRRTS